MADSAKERRELGRQQREADARVVMSLPAGQRFVWGVIDADCNTFGGSFAPLAPAPELAMAFNEGRRSVGIELLQEMQRVAPDLYAEMVAKAALEAAARAREVGVPKTGEALTR